MNNNPLDYKTAKAQFDVSVCFACECGEPQWVFVHNVEDNVFHETPCDNCGRIVVVSGGLTVETRKEFVEPGK